MTEKISLADQISTLERHCKDYATKLAEYYHGYHGLKEKKSRLEADLEREREKNNSAEEKYNQLLNMYNTLLSEQEHIQKINLISEFLSSNEASKYPHLEEKT